MQGLKKGYSLNVEYFSEILHAFRESSDYSLLVNRLIDVPLEADKRDTKAVKKIASAYLKLLFPHVEQPEDISKDDFYNYCLKPALEKRGIVRKQISLIDTEFHEEMPDIQVKEQK